MTVRQAVQELRSAGELKVEGDTILCRIPRRRSASQIRALDVVRAQKAQALVLIEERRERATGSLERVLKGFAIALYCDLVKETLWLVADEEDAEQLAKDGERRGAIYTGEEVRLVTAIKDPKVVKQVHEFKKEFDTRMLPPGKTDP